MKKRITLKSVAILALMFIIVSPAFTISNGSISYDGDMIIPSGGCERTEIRYRITGAAVDNDDGGDHDHAAVTMVDGNGIVTDVDIWRPYTGPFSYTGYSSWPINFLTARPVIFRFYDIPQSPYGGSGENQQAAYDWVVANGRLMDSFTIDPADYLVSCETFPYVEQPDDEVPIWHTDGRVNAKQSYAPLAVFPDGNGGMDVFATVPPGYEAGEQLLHIDAAAITAALALELGPTEQVLIAEANGVSVYMTGEGWIKVEQIGVFGMEFDAVMLGWTDPVEWDAPVSPMTAPTKPINLGIE